MWHVDIVAVDLFLLFLLSLNKCSYLKGELKSGQQILGYTVEKVCELKKKYMYCMYSNDFTMLEWWKTLKLKN